MHGVISRSISVFSSSSIMSLGSVTQTDTEPLYLTSTYGPNRA